MMRTMGLHIYIDYVYKYIYIYISHTYIEVFTIHGELFIRLQTVNRCLSIRILWGTQFLDHAWMLAGLSK